MTYRKEFCKAGISVFLMILVKIICLGQDVSYEQYTDKDGLPSMKTYDIVQDSTGLLWIGTENGLVSFDGEEFVRYSHPDLIDNDIVEVVLNRNNRIYFLNLSGQLGYLENHKISLINTDTIAGKIRFIISKKDKDYVVALANEVKLSFELIDTRSPKFSFIQTNIFYFHSEQQKTYSRLSKTDFQCINDSTNLKLISAKFEYLVSQESKYFYTDVGSGNEICNVDSTLTKYILEIPYERLFKYRDDYIIIKRNGITYYESKTKRLYHLLNGFKINAIFLDSENNTWISTPNRGLLKVSNLLVKSTDHKQSDIIFNNGINDIVQDSYGNIYLGTLSSEVIINPLKNRKNINVSESKRPIQFIKNDNIIIAFEDYAISIIESRTHNFYSVTNYRYSQKSLLFEDSIVYSGTASGLIKIPVEYYLSSNYNPSQNSSIVRLRISKIHRQDASKTIFVGTTNGLIRSVQDTFEFVNNEALKSLSITSIIDGDGISIWVGTGSGGIYNVLNDSIIQNFDITSGYKSNNVNNLEKVGNELLVSTQNGLFIIDLSTNKTKIVNEFNFLPTNEVLVCKVIDGKYWIGTIEGLTILSKEEINNSETKEPVLSMKSLLINGVKKDYEAGMVLEHTENNIQLNLQNISFKSGREKYIKYRIPFIDSTWISTIDPNLRLPSLQAGNYHIEAVGVNSIGIQSRPLNLYFKIDKAWWNKMWAKIAGILILLGIGNFIFLYRARRIRKDEKIKRDYLSQINKIKDQALQLQMNPHFIFNSLNAIQGFIGTDEEEMAMNYLARFARLIRLIFEHSKGNTITLEEELEFINLYLNLEKLRFKDKVNVKVTVDSEVEANKDLIKIPPLLIQPIVENSFKHGLFHKKGTGNLSIDYAIKDKVLQVTIQDDGIGREQSKRISQNNLEKQTCSGIKTTFERIDILNFGTDKKPNSLRIEDLYNEDGSPAGTKTILDLAV